MKKKKIIRLLATAAVFLIAPLFLAQQAAFAGQIGCQTGEQVRPPCTAERCDPLFQEKDIAAAQAKYMQEGQPPSAGGTTNGDSSARSQFSYFASVFFLLGGIWLLVSLLRERLSKNYAPKSARAAKVWNLALKPSFALSIFAFLFAAVIAGSVLTSPNAASAQKRRQNGQLNVEKNSQNLGLPTNQPVFKSAQQIGGNGTTQIGAPVFDAAGNRYVRGAFSGTLTIGETTLTATYGLDMFIAKYDANLNPLWVRQGSGMTSAPSEQLAVEGATAMGVFESFKDGGYLYIAGSFVKTLTLQGGANPSVTLSDNGAAGYNYETFVAKYDLNGNLIWARGGNSGSAKNPDNLETGQNGINKIVFDQSGDPYVAGLTSGDNFLGASISGFVCANTVELCTLHGKTDIIIAKLDKTTGAPTRMNVMGGTDNDNALDLAIDNVTNPNLPKLYLIGTIGSPQIQLPTAFGYETFNNNPNSTNSFVIKFEPNEQTPLRGIWAKVLNNDGIIGVNQVATDPQTGQLYITGYYTGTISGLGGPFGSSITNTRTGTGEAALAGYVASLESTDGTFYRLVNLGGAGNALAVRPDGTIFVVGTFWGTGEFVSGGDVRRLDSFGATDMFVAGIDRNNFSFDSVKSVNGSDIEGQVAVGNPSAADGSTINKYSPFGIAFNEGHVYVSGDFKGTLSLDCIRLNTPGASRQSYIAEFLGYGETTTCRIWANNDPSYRYWVEPGNWNAGIIPAEDDSVYVPYRNSSSFNPLYNPSFYTPNSNVPLGTVSISGNQTIVLQEDMTINDQLDLLGGKIDAQNKKVSLGSFAEAYSLNSGRVLGKVEKRLFGDDRSFTFPVGTANGYSPVTLSNYSAGKGALFAVTAYQGVYPFAATGLPVNRAARWWNLTNGGLESADLKFQYLPGDITAGIESYYSAYRIPAGGGTATRVISLIDTTAKTVNVPNVSQFSDWTLAQFVAPTAARVTVGGQVRTVTGQGISRARVVMTDAQGNRRQATTNSFGYYRFENVAAGAFYVFSAEHKSWGTETLTQIQQILDDRDDLDFIAPD